MSTWGIGDHHDSDEVHALKEQLRTKDAAHATLHGQLLKKEAELDGVKASLNDVLDKLRREADRVIQLDSDLKRRNEELANERLTRQNAEVALTAAHRKLKDSEHSALELQSTIDTLSSQSNSTLAGRSKLEQDNASLQARVRALERELQSKTHAEELALRQSQSASGRNRRRSSSESSFRIPALEKQLADLDATSNQRAAELQKTTEQLTRTRDALVQLQNEKTAAEKRLRRELEEVRATLDDREEDLRMLREAQGGADLAAREADLLERLEEEEKRAAALENELARSTGSRKRDLAMLQDELNRTTRLLEDATRKASEAEERLVELAREKEEALDERDRLEQERARLAGDLQVANSRASGPEGHFVGPSGSALPGKTPDEATVAMMEKLLNTIERLRGERDGLRRDLEFLNAENRFAVQSLEAKLVAATSAPTTPAADFAEINMLRGHVQAYQEQSERSARAVVALAVVAQHQSEGDTQRIQELSQELSHVHEHLQRAQQDLQQRQDVISELERRLSSTIEALHATESQVAALRSTIQRLEDDLSSERTSHVETGAALADAEEKLCAANLALTNAEAGRDALNLEKTHLQQDLETARQELADADERHTQQLNAISSKQPVTGVQAALRAQIQELEARVERRTAQIGMHQHDIARLEMNLKLQEERIAEMTAEMDVVQGEKDAMLEDCRTTRDQRDEALRRCDELEEALEAAEQGRETEVGELVHITFEAMAGRRDALLQSRRGGSVRLAEFARLEERIHAAESQKDAFAAQVSALSEERERLVQALDERTRAYEELRESHTGMQAETESTRTELSHLQAQLDEVSAAVRASEDLKAAAESEVASLRSDLASKEAELETLHNQLTAVRDSHADRQTIEATIFAQEKTELEARLQDAKTSLADLESRHRETMAQLERVEEDLKRAEDALTSQLSESAARSESEERLRSELSQVKKQHEEEIASLQDQLKAISEELEEVSRLRSDADASRRAAEEELAQTKQQLEARLAEAGDSLNTASRLEAELEQLKAVHDDEMQSLRSRLDDATAELDRATQRRDELQALHDQVTQQCEERTHEVADTREKLAVLETELAALREAHAAEREDLEKRLANATEELCTLRDSQSDTDTAQRQKMDELAGTITELEGRIIVLTKEADECRDELEDEKAAHSRTRESSTAELREVMAQRDELEAALTEAEKDLPAVRAQLEHAESSLAQAEEEKLSLQYQVTNLEAEIQRSKSLQRFLESEAAEGKRHVSTLETELEELRTKCTALDKLAKTTEANLAMQTIQHEQAVASLKRELNSLRAQPRLEDEIAELKEKNAEMEELLRAKCLEIEENDDRFIEMLKEKKKLNSKIDNLTRKVQNLQNKLNAAKENAAKASEVAPSPAPAAAPAPKQMMTFSPPLLAPAPVLSQPLSSSSSSRTLSRPRVVTAPAPSSPKSSYHQPPPMPTFRPKTPESRSRMVSGPSSLSRPKTPDSRYPPMPVFKARTPERQRAPTAPSYTQNHPKSMPESSSSSSVVGVKRRAPDDFDDCGSLPPQPFTADSAPGAPIPAQPTTPRLRKALQSMRTGFTPVRHHLGRAGSTSPSRRATTGSSSTAPIPPTISDVTNSPRASSHGENRTAAVAEKKGGWLGRLKSGPSQPRAPLSSRPPLFDPPGMR
ncbi:hypothetical protein C8Q70DRAFT_1152984 [Cubamyces menziesii]|nr:hypothetical protein C8Q70DRAFT_1152984 [Cubamyces menziesii]